MARFGDAALPRVSGHVPSRVDHADLTVRALRILLEEARERLGRGAPAAHPREPARTVGELGHRLRGDGAHARFGPGHDSAGAEVVRLHGNTEPAARRVSRDDRIRHRSFAAKP